MLTVNTWREQAVCDRYSDTRTFCGRATRAAARCTIPLYAWGKTGLSGYGFLHALKSR